MSSLHKNLSVKLGAIAAIQTIATCPATSPDEQVTKLHSTITAMLSSNTEYSLLEKAAEALGDNDTLLLLLLFIDTIYLAMILILQERLHAIRPWLKATS